MKKDRNKPKDIQSGIVPYGYLPYPEDEETIDLYEVWQTLKKRKKAIFFVTFFALALALVYLLIASPRYEAKATVKIGHFTHGSTESTLTKKIFEDARQLKREIDIKYDTAGKYRDKNETAYIKSAEVSKKDRDFLTITSYGPDNEKAVKVLLAPIEEILNRHESYRDSIVSDLKKRVGQFEYKIEYYLKKELPRLEKELDSIKRNELDTIESEISFIKNDRIPKIVREKKEIEDEIEKRRKEIEKTLTTLDANKNDTYSSLKIDTLQNDITRLLKELDDRNRLIETLQRLEIPKLEAKRSKIIEEKIPTVQAKIEEINSVVIPELRSKIESTRMLMAPPYLVPTHIVGEVYTLDHPVKPKKLLILAVALITGLMAGVFLALFMEFIAKREEK